jgi:ribonuclease-3
VSSPSTDDSAASFRALNHRFSDPALLRQALTHRSLGTPNNERLEFLGDGVLNMVVAELLYRARPGATEGDLSRLRARLVREETLAEIARELALGDELRLGSGELKSGGYLRDSILSDALEAIVGAVFLDAGFAAARALVADWMQARVAALPDAEVLKDAKTRLQELLQGRGVPLPVYELVDESGADHARRFTVRVRVPLLDAPVTATAGSRRRAEQRAASGALERINETGAA